MASQEEVNKMHQEMYGCKAEHVGFAPGRVNIIGEHTDYSQGFVLPVAIKQGTYVAISKKTIGGEEVHMKFVSSIDHKVNEVVRKSKEEVIKENKGKWWLYPYGVIDKLLERFNNEEKGVEYDVSINGDVPLGSGLSSSASIEVATAVTMLGMLNQEMDGIKCAYLCVEVEHEYAGVMCGVMDQFASRLCKKNCALLLDCKTFDINNEQVELKGCQLMITNSNAPHKLEASQYNERVKQCRAAVEELNKKYNKNEEYLRGFTVEEVQVLTGIVGNRAKHVVEENDRVMKSIEAMHKGDVKRLGELMTASHESLRKLFEVSSEELDYLVDNALKIEGVLGSRLTGAGFGGCTVTLLKEEAVEPYKEMLKRYEEKFNLKPFCFVLERPEDGAKMLY